MTTPARLERSLPTILGDLAAGPTPDYIDDVLGATARKRQRPAWTFPERWLPMADIASRPAFVPRLPWRAIGVALVLVALLVAGALIVGSQQRRLPAPFGPAANGLVAYELGGDIYTADPATGAATPIVSSPETDTGPRFSRDGTHLVFERSVADGLSELYVAGSDGRDLTLVTPEPVLLTKSLLGEPWEQYQFSPDGRSVLIASMYQGVPSISIAKADGSGIRRLELGQAALEPSFRPPDGAEILFVRPGTAQSGSGLYAVDTGSGVVRPIVAPSSVFDLAGANWSPDGSRIAYWRWGGPADGLTARTHVISADGSGDRALPAPPDAVWNAGSEWSNDGSRIFVLRGYTPWYDDVRPVVIPADGSSPGIEIPTTDFRAGECCATFEWAPDDSKILATPTDIVGRPLPQVILDLETRGTHAAPWTATTDPTWQRVKP
jgi:dipeptidyl aminopeptidase/acylaminoacyl peptidase